MNIFDPIFFQQLYGKSQRVNLKYWLKGFDQFLKGPGTKYSLISDMMLSPNLNQTKFNLRNLMIQTKCIEHSYQIKEKNIIFAVLQPVIFSLYSPSPNTQHDVVSIGKTSRC